MYRENKLLEKMRKLLQVEKVIRKKIVISGFAAVLLLLLYGLIFTFSEQDGETSGGLSYMISQKCVEILNALSGKNWSELVMQSMAEYFENPIRKLAHFCEYAVMGVLLFGVWFPWIGTKKETSSFVVKKSRVLHWVRRMPKLVKIIIPWVFISAALDEFHQLFIPGRCGSIWDVLLDTAGGGFGLLCCIVIVKFREKRKGKKKKL